MKIWTTTPPKKINGRPLNTASYYKSSKVCDTVLLSRRRFSTDRSEILQVGAGRDRERLYDLKF